MADEKRKGNGWGGFRPGSGRPKGRKTKITERARIEGLIWYRSDEIIDSMINHAVNGDATLSKYLGDRLLGRDTVPILDRVEQIEAALPEGWDAALAAEIAEKLANELPQGPWTKADAEQAGRLAVEKLRERMRRGDGQAAIHLSKVYYPDPILTLGEQAATMTPEQLRETMIRRYKAVWHWHSHEEILRMVDAIQSPAPSGEGGKE